MEKRCIITSVTNHYRTIHPFQGLNFTMLLPVTYDMTDPMQNNILFKCLHSLYC
jgi:hypothetical protein